MKLVSTVPALTCLSLMAACGSGDADPASVEKSVASTSVSSVTQAKKEWREALKKTPHPKDGCWHASYPGTWEQVPCVTAPLAPHAPATGIRRVTPAPHAPATGTQRATPGPHTPENGPRPETVGNGTDYVAAIPGILQAVGAFPIVNGLTSEFDEASANSYSLQLNTNAYSNNAQSACNNAPGCQVWEQFVYDNLPKQGEGNVYIQYWLLNYISSPNGPSKCPNDTWAKSGNSCYKNNPGGAGAVAFQDITNLTNLELQAATGDCDVAILFIDGEGAAIPCTSSIFNLASNWNQAEFNVFGTENASEAILNSGASLLVSTQVLSLSSTTPSCLNNGSGSTGETNNLNLIAGSCEVTSGNPWSTISFEETNVAALPWAQWSGGTGYPQPPSGIFTPTLAQQTTGVVPITIAHSNADTGNGPYPNTYALVQNTDSNGDHKLYFSVGLGKTPYKWTSVNQSFTAISQDLANGYAGVPPIFGITQALQVWDNELAGGGSTSFVHDTVFDGSTSIAAWNATSPSGFVYATSSTGTTVSTASSPGGQTVYRFKPSSTEPWPAGTWTPTDFGGSQVTADGTAGVLYVLGSGGHVWKLGKTGVFTLLTTSECESDNSFSPVQIAAVNGTVMGLGPGGGGWYYIPGSGAGFNCWTEIDTKPFVSITGDNTGKAWASDSSGYIWASNL
jgi:hypothetical protein